MFKIKILILSYEDTKAKTITKDLDLNNILCQKVKVNKLTSINSVLKS